MYSTGETWFNFRVAEKSNDSNTDAAMKTAHLIILVLGGLLAFAIGSSVYLWWRLEDVEVGIRGNIALILGILFTFTMWVGLMCLIRHSPDDI